MSKLPQTALIAGGGIAGALASAVLRRAGWHVTLVHRPSVASPHLGHVHTVSETTLSQMEQQCGQSLAGWQRAPACLSSGGDCTPLPARPVVDAMRLCDAVREAAHPYAALNDSDLTSLSVQCDRWQLNNETFDLLVDATGPSPALKARLAALSGVDLEWLESDDTEICLTYRASACDVAVSTALTVVLPNLAEGKGGLLVLDGKGGGQLTLRGSGISGSTLSDCAVGPEQLCQEIASAGGATLHRLANSLCFGEKPHKFRAPLARRVNLEDWSDSLPPLLSIGDALLQTAPSLGQGLRLMVQQAETMRSIGTHEDAKALRRTQIGQAQGLWLMSQMQAGMQQMVIA